MPRNSWRPRAASALLMAMSSMLINASPYAASLVQVPASVASYKPSNRELSMAATRVINSQAFVMGNCSSAVTISRFCTAPAYSPPTVCVGSTAAGSCPMSPLVLEVDTSSNLAYMVDASGLGIEHVGDLNSLEVLNLAENKLTSWPTTSGVLRLNLARNRLTSFDVVGINGGLEELNVSSNLLSSIRLGANSESLKLLDASNGSLTDLNLAPATRLASVLAPYNKLTDIANVSLPNQLRLLDVSHNKIDDWGLFTPPEGLRTLNASNNQANSFLRGNWSVMAPKLETAIFADNNITHVSSIAWPSTLKNLDLRGNPLQWIEIFRSDLAIFQSLQSFLAPESALSMASATCAKRNATSARVAGGVSVCVIESALEHYDQGSKRAETNPPRMINKPPSPPSASSHLIAWIIVGTTACAFAVLVIFCMRRRQRHQASSSVYKLQQSSSITASGSQSDVIKQALASLWSNESLMTMHVDDSDVETIRNLQDTESTIASLVRIGDTTLVCKRLKHLEELSALRLIEEIKTSAPLEHARIVRYRGLTATSLTNLAIYSDFMVNGSLESFLTSARTNPLPWLNSPQSRDSVSVTLLGLAIEVAEALTYLHSFDPPVVHGCIRPKNIFLNSKWRAKLSGVGRRYEPDRNATSWLAPEILTANNKLNGGERERDTAYSAASDVFAFGAFLVDLDSFGDESPADVLSLAAACLETDPMSRPSAMTIFYRLSQVRKRAHARAVVEETPKYLNP